MYLDNRIAFSGQFAAGRQPVKGFLGGTLTSGQEKTALFPGVEQDSFRKLYKVCIACRFGVILRQALRRGFRQAPPGQVLPWILQLLPGRCN